MENEVVKTAVVKHVKKVYEENKPAPLTPADIQVAVDAVVMLLFLRNILMFIFCIQQMSTCHDRVYAELRNVRVIQ